MAPEAIEALSYWMIVPAGLLGSLLHFLYDWARRHRLAAILGAVNESYWEHIKIAIWPLALLHVALFVAGGHALPAFVPASTLALYSVPISMVGLIFSYKTVTKRNVLWLDISVFFMVIALAQVIFVLTLQQLAATWPTLTIASAFLAALVFAFFRFTLRPPPETDVFIDPITQRYGVPGNQVNPRICDKGR